MKRNLFILLAALCLSACTKEETRSCWTCEYNTNTSGVHPYSTVCEKSPSEITQHEKDNDISCSQIL